jgi:hypothetical protein
MYNIRKADPKDLPVIVEYRILMFQTFLKALPMPRCMLPKAANRFMNPLGSRTLTR